MLGCLFLDFEMNVKNMLAETGAAEYNERLIPISRFQMQVWNESDRYPRRIVAGTLDLILKKRLETVS